MSVIEHLTRTYDDDFTIDIPRWELPDVGVTALFGPSGAGKSSVFRLLIGLDRCPRLKWTMDGVDLARVPVPERRLGVVFQNADLFPHLTAEENIVFAARARRVSATVTAERLKALVADLTMGHYLGRRAAKLSGGEAQRVALARALIGQPRFLFLDEPFSALDANLKAEARAAVAEVIAKARVPTLLVSHDEDDLAALADHRVRIADGRLVR